ncbi:MDR family MFS transporter [Paenibacillus harenae]|uniref:EmrB/QacA subfamily drug resistance transporter n=1 Tax=Paenibacillus harenae TaxID=306543 RepID=A0ABT9UAR9_PAEHA|nr:MDR family MFS transporter [Paenibacillus harenae]MDQ0116734.1 EmrB/QacA subfamily drug resistance transporter [Paenibacillus harenae]
MQAPQNRKQVTIALFVATFLAAIEGTIVSTAMPSITSELEGIRQYSWIISIYLLATVITTPVYGKLSDLYGRKRMFIVGALIFLAGSMLSGVAQTMNQLIWFRALQGLGAGALTTIPYTIIGDLYPYEKRAKVQGWMSSVWGIAGISGPLLGGLLVDYVSWRAIFYMNLPFGIAAIYMLSAALRESFEKKKRHIDYIGIALFTIGMFAFLYGMTLLRDKDVNGISSLAIGTLFATAVVFLALFVAASRRSDEPIIPFELFKIRIISVANLAGFLICVVNVVIIFYLPLWIQGVYDKPATYSGLVMIPLSIAWPLGAILAGNWIAKLGVRLITVTGACLLLISGIGLALMDPQTPFALFIVYTLLSGLSFGLTLTSLTVTVSSAVGWEQRGSAVASNNFIRTLGQTIGITAFGMMLNTGSTNRIDAELLEASLHTIFIWVALLSVVILLVSATLPNRRAAEQQSSAS